MNKAWESLAVQASFYRLLRFVLFSRVKILFSAKSQNPNRSFVHGSGNDSLSNLWFTTLDRILASQTQFIQISIPGLKAVGF